MSMSEYIGDVIDMAEEDIRTAIEDYKRHTYADEMLSDISGKFIRRLAKDSIMEKWSLREFFSKSKFWNPELNALVLDGVRNYIPNTNLINRLYYQITKASDLVSTEAVVLTNACEFFMGAEGDDLQKSISAIEAVAPGAYKPGKKKARVFRDLCRAIGVYTEEKGSDFQKLFAKFADAVSPKTETFKLFISINPAHFLTMSNPKDDERGSCLTSCHSLNDTEYPYNNGCSGYARDSVSFIVFTVDDPSDIESLNNRKTSRQVFAYAPGNGVLLQSRLYNTGGGTYGAQRDSDLYLEMVQQEISKLEGFDNDWVIYPSYERPGDSYIEADPDFGGYQDWDYSSFGGRVCIQYDHKKTAEPLVIGRAGLCICCGEETSEGLYCDFCCPDKECCEDCGAYVVSNDLVYAHGSDGCDRYVCEDCLRNYELCEQCNEYYPMDSVYKTQIGFICESCANRYEYICCDSCGLTVPNKDTTPVYDINFGSGCVCDECLSRNYSQCELCGEYYSPVYLRRFFTTDGTGYDVCSDCAETQGKCIGCRNWQRICYNGSHCTNEEGCDAA